MTENIRVALLSSLWQALPQSGWCRVNCEEVTAESGARGEPGLHNPYGERLVTVIIGEHHLNRSL